MAATAEHTIVDGGASVVRTIGESRPEDRETLARMFARYLVGMKPGEHVELACGADGNVVVTTTAPTGTLF